MAVEVADTTLHRDRTNKKRLYARTGIPVYWLINLGERQIEVYTYPVAPPVPDYQQHQDYYPADEIPLVIAEREIGRLAVRDLLP